MNDDQINMLQTLCKKSCVMWNPDPSTARHVVSVSTRKDELDEYCAYFDNGEYVVLYNCPLHDFIVAERLV